MHDEDGGPRDEIDTVAATWRRDGLGEPLIAMLEVGKRAARIDSLVQQALRPELAELGLTYAEFEVLTVLRRSGAPYRLRPSELTRSAFLTSGGTSNVLQRLQKAGHIERTANAGDARSRFVQLTAEGLRVTELGLAASARSYEEVMTGVPPETVRAAADALREVLLVIGRRRFR
ncbi:MarR family winged helix-turn-helix transcriptional regulator [Actinomadura roseirufa]|uniref:MarR family winged helix-turn-helix transcriptional regulator n=1 Tax=Actinomadura roseirufa TaxID=2094049 RepID=UPI0013F168FB|nr:MarR family transcriptional regulator [Actinomadura roseirufa]